MQKSERVALAAVNEMKCSKSERVDVSFVFTESARVRVFGVWLASVVASSLAPSWCSAVAFARRKWSTQGLPWRQRTPDGGESAVGVRAASSGGVQRRSVSGWQQRRGRAAASGPGLTSWPPTPPASSRLANTVSPSPPPDAAPFSIDPLLSRAALFCVETRVARDFGLNGLGRVLAGNACGLYAMREFHAGCVHGARVELCAE